MTMFSTEIGTTWVRAGLVAVSSVVMLFGIIGYIRIAGLRSFSKMSAFDFAVTLSIGSILGAVSLSSSSLADGLVAVGILLGCQVLIARLRRAGPARVLDNEPVVLMHRGGVLDEGNMHRTRITRDDLIAKLREANVGSLQDVDAVVLETTGDITVMHGHGGISEELLSGVRRPRD